VIVLDLRQSAFRNQHDAHAQPADSICMPLEIVMKASATICLADGEILGGTIGRAPGAMQIKVL